MGFMLYCFLVKIRLERVLNLCKFMISGGHTLNGELTVSGSKNAVLPIICATVLAEGPCTIENIPNIADVKSMLNILKKLGADQSRDSECSAEES